MGSDDLFRKRKAWKAERHRRRKAKQSPYERVLIVCEGAKTEPNYFRWLRETFRLNRENVVVAHKKTGLDPKSLVEYAISEYNAEKDFDRVCCVFDRDKHATYQAALDKIRSTRLKGGRQIHAITSVPCFELWLLLHFTCTTRQYCAPLGGSDCELVIDDLKNYIPGYEKRSMDLLLYIDANRVDDAITNAKHLERFHETSGTDNPSTKVFVLVEYLKGLRRW
jgi:hypothetical protein